MSETATTTARKTYTRRTTRDRVVDLLEEAIRLVKARCVEPEKGAGTKAARDILAESKKEFAEAVEMKRQANAALQTATALASSANEAEAEAAPTVIPPLPMTLKKKTKTAAAALAATGGAGATAAPLTATATAKNTTLKVKKAPSCPGGPKAFNEFLKSKRAEVEAELGGEAPYSEVRARIAQLWKETCSSTGSKRTTRKVKTPATPGRVNAPVSLAPVPGAALSAVPEASESKEAEEEESKEQEQEAEDENAVLPVQSYEDLGMDDMFGMRKVRVEGRDLYMSDNMGLFNRNDEDDDPLGEFVGYLRNGKIVEQNAPNS